MTSSCSTERPSARVTIWCLVAGSVTTSFRPARRSASTSRRASNLFNMFVQDEITVGRRVKVTLGSKLEHDSLAGWGALPSARVMWNVTPTTQRAWAAVSRARRTPSSAELGMRVNFAAIPGDGIPLVFGLVGNPDFQTEQLTEVEGGYRFQIGSTAAFDVAVFRGGYAHLSTTEPIAPSFKPRPSRTCSSPTQYAKPSQCQHRRRRDRRALDACRLVAARWLVFGISRRDPPMRPATTRPVRSSMRMRPSTSGNFTRRSGPRRGCSSTRRCITSAAAPDGRRGVHAPTRASSSRSAIGSRPSRRDRTCSTPRMPNTRQASPSSPRPCLAAASVSLSWKF